MKVINLVIALLISVIAFGQTTYVPDDNFEAYLEANGMGNGIANDDLVTTANINTVTSLNVSNQNIADMTGIEDFTALVQLRCFRNQITSLDVSNNTALNLLSCYHNQLTSLDLSNNTALLHLYCQINQLNSLDVSNNTVLFWFYCYNNQLTSLNVANGNNASMIYMQAHDNSDLQCIQVDDAANTPPAGMNWSKDATANYSDNCSPSVPLSNWAIYLGLLLIVTFVVMQYKRKLA